MSSCSSQSHSMLLHNAKATPFNLQCHPSLSWNRRSGVSGAGRRRYRGVRCCMEIDMVKNQQGTYAAKKEKVVVLWDLDNKPPRGPPYDAAVSLKSLAVGFGELVEFSAYANRHAFVHLPQWVVEQRRERKSLDILERKGAVRASEAYTCGVCGRKCGTHVELKRHFRQLHERERQKKLNRLRSLKGKRKRERFKERFLRGNHKYDEAARTLLVPKVGYGLAAELRRAGVFVKTVRDKPQAADWALKRQMVHSMSRGIDWLFLVSDDSDFSEMLRRAREVDLGTVVVGDWDRALGRHADLWLPWTAVENGEVDVDVLPKRRKHVFQDHDLNEEEFLVLYSEDEDEDVDVEDYYEEQEEEEEDGAAGPHTIVNGKEVVNFASANYLGFIGHPKLLDSCSSALAKYGVASCGPRGFYGTIDVHLDCETRIAKFLGTPDSILYSYGLSTMFSAIPAFSKKGDIIVADEGVHWGIQNGLYLSRSTVVYFKHNDMDSLRETLEKIPTKYKRTKNLRRYIVIEAVYQNSGQIAPLDEIIKLKEKHCFRVLLDESNSLGVLGSSGRGLTEYYGVPAEKIDIITASMGHALATEGGFCTGNARVIDHQRLSSSGYVFSASLPPYLASAAITAIDVLEENPNLITKLKSNITLLRKGLSKIPGFTIASNPESPIVYLRLEKSTGSMKDDLNLLENIAERVLKEESVFVVTSKRSTLDKCRLPVGIRLFVSAGHSESDLLKASESLKKVAASVLGGHN